VISFVVVEAYNLALVAHHRLVLEYNSVEVVVPIAVEMVAAEAAHMAVEAVAPIVVHIEMEVVHTAVEVAHTEVAALVLVAGLDHMT